MRMGCMGDSVGRSHSPVRFKRHQLVPRDPKLVGDYPLCVLSCERGIPCIAVRICKVKHYAANAIGACITAIPNEGSGFRDLIKAPAGGEATGPTKMK